MSTLRSILDYLVAHMGAVILVIALLVVAIIVLIVLDLRRKANVEEEEEGDGEFDDEESSGQSITDDVGQSFSRAVSALRSFVPGSRYRYRIPWFAVVGPRDSGSTRVLNSTGLPRRFEDPMPARDHGDSLAWFFFDQGVFIDVAGDLILRPDGTADERAWDRLLKRLLRNRPERPLDGVVLTLSVKDLLASNEDRLTRDGAEIFQRLRRAQHILGVRFPVYVIFTHCDEIPGFDSLVGALPEVLRQDIFGWSSPYAVEAAFAPSWLDDGFDSIRQELFGVVTEVLALRDDVGNPDAVFRFPDRIAALGPSVRTLLTEVFRESAYHEGFFFRGLYFTGDPQSTPAGAIEEASEAAAVEKAAEGSHDPTRRLAFLHRLFQRKIVPERGLSRGFTDSVLGRNRTIRNIKIALMVMAVVAPVTLWLGYRSVNRAVEPLSELLGAMTTGVSGTDDVGILNLLTSLADVDAGNIGTVFLPSSWTTSLNEEAAGSFEIGFESVILPRMKNGILIYKDSLMRLEDARILISKYPPDEAARNFTSEEARFLYNYVKEVKELSETVWRYNTLQDTTTNPGPLDKFIGIAEWYYIEPPLPDDFAANFKNGSAFYRSGLMAADLYPVVPLDLAGFSGTAVQIGREVADSLYGRLLGDLQRLDVGLSAMDFGEDVDFDALRVDVARLRDFFAGVDPFWTDNLVTVMDPATEAMLDAIQHSTAFHRDEFISAFRDAVEASRAQGLLEAVLLLRGEGGRNLRQLIQAPGDLTLGVDSSLVKLDALFDKLEGAEFFRGSTNQPPAQAPYTGDGRRVWDPLPLLGALDDVGEYRAVADSLPPSLRRVASDSVTARVAQAIMRAQEYERGPVAAGRAGLLQDLTRRMTTFDAAMEPMREILATTQGSGASQSVGDRIAAAIVLEASEVLEDALALIAEGQPWEPVNRSMAAWTGEGPAAYAVFPAKNADELKAYLDAEREGLADIADRYARRMLGYVALPAVQSLLRDDSRGFGSGTLTPIYTWEGIVRGLDQYAEQVAGNSLEGLERFITEDLAVSSPAACPEGPAEGTARSRDYFGSKTARLRSLFQTRCQQLALQAFGEEYDSLASFFNRRVRGRFPFVAPEQAREAMDIDGETARELFARYDHLAGLLGGEAVSAVGRAPGAAPAERFLRSVAGARDLLRPLLDELADPAAQAIPYRVDFRTNQDREIGGGEIVDWRVVIGGQAADFGQDAAARSGEWRLGERASLSLTWASESPYTPAWGGETAVVEGKTIVWAYDGPWAVLRLLMDHRDVQPAGGMASPRRDGGVLRVEVTTSGPEPTESLVFLEIIFSGPTGAGERVVPAFPLEAPALPPSATRR